MELREFTELEGIWFRQGTTENKHALNDHMHIFRRSVTASGESVK
jgi:hypothetical protein